jgi:NAD(P)-dependent dehydrogenase (short-subunit alcohol dehydrogenase family)
LAQHTAAVYSDQKVLVLGSAGRIGRAVVAELNARGARVRGFDRARTPGIDHAIVGDITDRDAVARATAGVDTVIHLAATPDDVEDVVGQLFPANIVGVYHVMEAARVARVKRLILASSMQVNWWQGVSGRLPLRSDDPPSPRYWYAATKMFLESIGRGYAETHGIGVIVARLGWCPRTPEQVQELAADEDAQDFYLSPADSGRFFACAVESSSDIRFAVVYASSKPVRRSHLDLESAKELLGYVPEETWPQGVGTVLADFGRSLSDLAPVRPEQEVGLMDVDLRRDGRSLRARLGGRVRTIAKGIAKVADLFEGHPERGNGQR